MGGGECDGVQLFVTVFPHHLVHQVTAPAMIASTEHQRMPNMQSQMAECLKIFAFIIIPKQVFIRTKSPCKSKNTLERDVFAPTG